LKRLGLCVDYAKRILNKIGKSWNMASIARYVSRLTKGRHSRRMGVVAIFLVGISVVLFYLKQDTLKIWDPVVAVIISGLIGYGAFLDEKHFEKLIDIKMQVYTSILMDIKDVYSIPGAFLENKSIQDVFPKTKLEQAFNGALLMHLVSSTESCTAYNGIASKIQDKILSLYLLAVNIEPLKAEFNHIINKSGFYRSLDTTRMTPQTIRDNVTETGDKLIAYFSEFLKINQEVFITIIEINDLVTDLINEMRKDLEIGEFTLEQLLEMKQTSRDSIEKGFKFLGDFVKLKAKENGV